MNWDILRTERLGSRDKDEETSRCKVCGKYDDGDFFVSATGEIFCSMECRMTKFNLRRGFKND